MIVYVEYFHKNRENNTLAQNMKSKDHWEEIQ